MGCKRLGQFISLDPGEMDILAAKLPQPAGIVPSVAIAIPSMWMPLFLHGRWRSLCVPGLEHSSNRTGQVHWDLLPELACPPRAPTPVVLAQSPEISVSQLQNVADLLRESVHLHDEADQLERAKMIL